MVVECKAWGMPIAKEVVSKLSYVMGDLGINKGIIVSLKGWTTGAELSARQLAIELWGTEEVQNKLGQVAVAEVELGHANRAGHGLPVQVSEELARPLLLSMARGFLGFGREDVVWLKLVWVPFVLLELSHSRSRQSFLKGTITETTTRWNLYEGLSGTFFMTFETEPELTEVVLGQSVAARIQPRRIQKELNETVKKAHSVVTQSAQQRYANRLTQLGVPIDSESTSVDRAEEIHIPLYLALLRSGDRNRVVSLDAVWGRRMSALDGALTESASYLRDALPRTDADALLRVPGTGGIPRGAWLIALRAIAIFEYRWTDGNVRGFVSSGASKPQ